MTESPEAAAAYEALREAIERVAALPDDEVEQDDSVTLPVAEVVMEYAVVAALTSFELVEAESTQYLTIFRDPQGRALPHHHSEGLLRRGIGWLNNSE